MLKFEFSEKDLEIVSPPHFVRNFSREKFCMLHFINWPNFIVLLPWLLNDTHMEELVLCKNSLGTRLAGSDVFHMFTQSIKFF